MKITYEMNGKEITVTMEEAKKVMTVLDATVLEMILARYEQKVTNAMPTV